MITEFKFIGLERLNNENYMSATCELTDKEETFHALIEGDDKKKESLWAYCEGNWNDKRGAVIRHDGLNSGGKPINPILISIIE